VQTFVSDEWTLEYDLAIGPKDENGGNSCNLAEDVYVATCLAENDEAINAGTIAGDDVARAAMAAFDVLKTTAVAKNGSSVEETIAATIYAKLARDGVSKPITAQYLAERLQSKRDGGELTREDLRKRLPKYLTQAIDYVTGAATDTLGEEVSVNE
jgi:putative ATP-dependent endonuclease of OLD family